MRASILTLLMLLAGAAVAQDIRIGYVDMKQLLDNAPQVIAGRAELDIEFRPVNDELLEDEARLLQLEQELASASGLTREQVAAREREIRNLNRSIERRREDLADELNFRRNQQIKELGEEIEMAVETVARREGYDLVLSSPVAYASDAIDITDKVLTFLETDYERRGQRSGR
ncbi:MAG: OmpH family outer membrane protein [Wenzhouxiangellaceae bacterium]|nr:OmpH family outer membrane protein [Wenzhouxiangellaceae bacterium]MBS3746995.1 OmpH family outer membrane protein [Wenzhouxiangellaceae bacterium]MBS3822307.1 OmpH family outer membrane protein [Wenzhouxiangellaceae bacterium]